MKGVISRVEFFRFLTPLLATILTSCATISIPDYPPKWGKLNFVSDKEFSLDGIYFNDGGECYSNQKECIPISADEILFADEVCHSGYDNYVFITVAHGSKRIGLKKMPNGNIEVSALKNGELLAKKYWIEGKDFKIKDGSLIKTWNCYESSIGDGWVGVELIKKTYKINLTVENHLIFHEIESDTGFGILMGGLPVIVPIRGPEIWYRFKKFQDSDQSSSDLHGPGF